MVGMKTGTGFYANGGGNFRVGREQGVGISFDSSTGLLIMSSSTFLMGVSGSADGNGLQPIGAFISGSNGNLEISSSGFHFKPAGDAVLAGGNITFEKDGDITSNDYLIERSRLFGSGEDGDIVVSSNAALSQDYYYENCTINDNISLDTNGYRLFVRDTLTLVGSNSVIHNNGTTATSRLGAIGGAGGTLVGGTLGASGGSRGLAGGTGAFDGGTGGGAGGGGGHVMIFARIIINNGTIRSNGGNGRVVSNATSQS